MNNTNTVTLSENPQYVSDSDDGTINEKPRTYGTSKESTQFSHSKSKTSYFDPSSQLSHKLHALVGLDRYPTYLSRWSMEDIDSLEASMKETLQQIKSQREFIKQQRQMISNGVMEVIEKDDETDSTVKSLLTPPTTWKEIQETILDPRASEAIFGSKWFRKRSKDSIPTVEQVLNGEVDIHLDPSQLELWMDQEMFDVYSFPIFSQQFCKRIHQSIQKIQKQIHSDPQWHYQQPPLPQQQISTSNKGQRKRQGPIDLDTIGYGWISTLVYQLIIRPLSRHLYTDSEIYDELDWRQGYVASYAPKKDTTSSSSYTSTPLFQQNSRLVPHTDDSEVTLNLCLGDTFTGGNVSFYGLRGTADEGIKLGEYEPEIGRALLHAGRHLHEVTNVTSGNRFVLIVWARSWKGIRSVECPCCWLNRRTDIENENDGNGNRRGCIFKPRWN